MTLGNKWLAASFRDNGKNMLRRKHGNSTRVISYRRFKYAVCMLNAVCIPLIIPSDRTPHTAHICYLNTLRPRQNGRRFADDIFKCIFLDENVWIPTKISMKFVPKRPINNIPSLVQIMAWRRPGDKPLFEPMMVSSTTHICVTRPQWVKASCAYTCPK